MDNIPVPSPSPVEGPLYLTDLDHEGRGVGRTDGKVVFVAGALPGETVFWRCTRSKKSMAEGVATRWLQSVSVRRTPPCMHASRCGGCQWQHIDDHAQVAFKQRVFEAQLRRIGKVQPAQWLAPIYGLSWHYRERVRFSVDVGQTHFSLGFRVAGSHDVVDIQDCAVLAPAIANALDVIRNLLKPYAHVLGISQVQVCEGDGVLALLVSAKVAYAQVDQAAWQAGMDALGVHSGRPWQLWWAERCTAPRPAQPVYATVAARLQYRLPEYDLALEFTPQDFTQANSRTNALMVHRAMNALQPQAGEHIIDWFCGLGNFTLPMARMGADVVGVEGVAAMVCKAVANAKANHLASKTRFAVADLFAVTALDLTQWGHVDKWLLDPPRAGAQALVQALHGLPEPHLPRRIVYVSCNPGTLARDAAVLVARGYRFTAAGMMNVFAQTAHVESMAVFDWPGTD